MIKVSIIIPFYNVENYIEQCLKSVIAQTLTDIEIILINDASTDKTREIVQQYVDIDNRIKIIDLKEHKGQGYARNRGIEIAKGIYTGFVDSDDFIEKDMFEQLYKMAEFNDTDITMCQVDEYDDINNSFINSDYYSLSILNRFYNKVFSAKNTANEILNINVALWNKIYKREFLIQISEKFPEGFIYEDLPFFFGTYLKAERINIVWQKLYHYRINRKNSTMKQFNNKILDRIPMVSLSYQKMKNTPFLSDKLQQIQGWVINDLFHRYILLKENCHREFFFLMKKTFISLDIQNKNDYYFKTVYHFDGYLLVINNTFENFCQKVFNKYLDIKEIENRLRSEITNNFEIEKKLAIIENKLDICQNSKNEIDNIKKLTDNLQYEINAIRKFITPKTNFEENISSEKNDIKELLTKQLKTETESLYNDIKDLSFLMYDKYASFATKLEALENHIELIEEKICDIQLNFDKNLDEIKTKLNSISKNIEN